MSYVTYGAAYPAQESGRRPGILETTRATTIPSTGMANTIVIKMKLSAMNSNSIYPLFSELDILGRHPAVSEEPRSDAAYYRAHRRSGKHRFSHL